MRSLRNPIVVATLIALSWSVARVVIAHRTGIPVPQIHDEFSYLLGADTFAKGRLANPPHPIAEFFDSPHVLVRPVYASKYPPGQALVLALGEKVFGSPFWGVVIENALLIFTVALAVSVWVSTMWGAGVAVILALYLLPPNYWADSYWGGALTAAGGTLVVLAIVFHRDRRLLASGLAFGSGAAILFFTRPYEGGAFTLAIIGVYFVRNGWRFVLIPALAAAPILLAALAWTGYYNRAVTGDPFLLPYILHDRQYNVAPPFWILPRRPEPVYSHPRLAAQHGLGGWEDSAYSRHRPWWNGLARGVTLSLLFTASQVSGFLGLLVFAVPVAWRDWRFRQLSAVLLFFIAALSIESFNLPHYAAPALGAVAILTGVWLERLWTMDRHAITAGKAVGVAFFGFAIAGMNGAEFLATPLRADRQQLIQRLSTLNAPQLVLVRYPTPSWNIDVEWVYNSADIDSQHVIFAHDLGPERDENLLRYYPGRQAWIASVDDSGYRLDPYPSAATDATAARAAMIASAGSVPSRILISSGGRK